MKFLQWQHVTWSYNKERERHKPRERESPRERCQAATLTLTAITEHRQRESTYQREKEKEGEREPDSAAPAPFARQSRLARSFRLRHNFGILMRNPYLCCLFCQKIKKKINKTQRERVREGEQTFGQKGSHRQHMRRKVKLLCRPRGGRNGGRSVGVIDSSSLVAFLWPVGLV